MAAAFNGLNLTCRHAIFREAGNSSLIANLTRRIRCAMKSISIIILLYFFLAATLLGKPRVKTGDEIFVERYLHLVKGKRIGIITNQSGILYDGHHIVDVLAKIPEVKVAALFAPEHGIRSEAPAGAMVSSNVDSLTGIPIYSLYGKVTKPTPSMLKGIDMLIYDIQDVGARFYTFISTLDLTLESAAENHIKYIVLDRPDMLRANFVDGPVLADSLRSFVGIQPIPSVYGMTPGEFSEMINDEHWLRNGVKADLTVIRMENYKRQMWYDETGLKWIKPSPNLPNMNAIENYPGLVLLEGTNISEGRGTDHPFENIGAPFVNAMELAGLLNERQLEGVKFDTVSFIPRSLPWASEPKFKNEVCHGVRITVTGRDIFRPVEMGVTLIWAIRKLYPDSLKIRGSIFDRLCGTPEARIAILNSKSPEEIFENWEIGVDKFLRIRKKYLMYK